MADKSNLRQLSKCLNDASNLINTMLENGSQPQQAALTPAQTVTRSDTTTQQKTHNLFWPDENSIEQCCAAHIVQGCHQHCSILLHLIAG